MLLDEIAKTDVPYLLLDYIGYNDGPEDRITIQHVPPVFYGIKASYPCIFFSRTKLRDHLSKNFELKYEFISAHEKYYVQLRPFRYEGALWKLRKSDAEGFQG